MAIHFVEKQARWPLFFIAFLKCTKHNYQLDQVLENFKYSFYFDGITLRRHDRLSPLISRQNDIKHFSFANVFAENNEVTSLQLVHNQGIKRHHNVPSTNWGIKTRTIRGPPFFPNRMWRHFLIKVEERAKLFSPLDKQTTKYVRKYELLEIIHYSVFPKRLNRSPKRKELAFQTRRRKSTTPCACV